MILKLTLYLSLCCLSKSASITNQQAMDYLDRFGYLKKTKESMIPEKKSNSDILLKESLKLFQSLNSLNVTGKLDAATIKKIQTPRCGNSDFPSNFVTVTKWSKKKLKYAVRNRNKELKSKTNRILAQALKYWSAVTPLTFRRVRAKRKHDIDIKFGSRMHGDPYPFDGPGGVLAHAFFPEDGRVHFDEDERFTDKSYSGINLKIVAVHEFGHALGLGHSSDINAVMYPYYTGYNPKFKLGADDIKGIRSLYGKK